ncbi:hypothetical protein N7540_006254 [Penicillium herquei]|nr:hypothetical protein N7540_006254 [Penicillium herquei]
MSEMSNQALFDAIEANDLTRFQQALTDEISANVRDKEGNTALLEATKSAIKNNDLKIMENLIEKGAKLDLQSDGEGAPLHFAAYWNAGTDLLQLLLSKGASVNLQRGSDSSTPLFRAVQDRNLEATRLLLEHGADPNIENDRYGAPLHYAAYYGHDEIIDLLLANDANINMKRERDGVTPLYEAVRGEELETAKKLFQDDSDLKIVNEEGETFLHHAVGNHASEFLDLFKWSNLKECPVDVNSVTTDNETPLMFAARARSVPGVEWLLQRGANVDTRDQNQTTAFLVCAEKGNVQIGELLVGRSPNVIYGIDNEGRGAFHYAAGWGRENFIEWLHNISEATDVDPNQGKALDPNRTDIYGMTFIHRALDYYEPSIVESCLRFCKSTIVDEVDHMGNTPLHIALESLSDEVKAQSILLEKMSLSARCKRNKDGKSILSLAIENAIDNAEPGTENFSADLCKDFLLKLFRRPVDVGYSELEAWPKIIRTNPDHVTYIVGKLKELFGDSGLPETIIFWAARNGAQDLVNDCLAKLTDSCERKRVISETLYWASASEQKDIVDSLTAAYRDEVRCEAKTIEAVRAAAFAGYESIVQSLLSCIRFGEDGPMNKASTGLFWAVTWKSEHARDVVRRLLMNGASPNSIAVNRQTILQWAMDYHDKISKIDGKGKDGKENYDMLGLLECPIRVPPRPEAPQRPKVDNEKESEASKHICTISDFYCQDEAFYTLQRRSKCHEVIYKEGVAKKMKDSWNEWFPKDESRPPDFRWVHLPVNDWDLAQDLIDFIYFENTAGASDLGYTRCKDFVRGTQKEHTGSTQSSFMYPAFHAKTTKEDARALIPKKNPTSGSEGNKNAKKTTEFEGEVNRTKTEHHIPVDPTAGENEDAENRDSSLADPSIKNESRSNFTGTDEPSELKNLSGNEQEPDGKIRPPEGTEQSKPTHSLPSVDGTASVLTTQGELDTHREQNEKQASLHFAEGTNSDANQSSANLDKSGPGERNSTHLQVPKDGQPNYAASLSGDNQSILSQRGANNDPKNAGDQSQKHPAGDSSALPNAEPDRGHSQVIIQQKKQLEKCKVALYMPFLTFQTVKEQRKRRQDIAQSEFVAQTPVSLENAASKTDPKDHTKQTYKELSRAAASILESESSPCNELSQEMIFKAILCSIRHHKASGQSLNAKSAAELLKRHVASMDKDGKLPSTTHRSPLHAKFWKKESSGSPQKEASTTDMNQAIEYLIDALTLANNSTPGIISLTNNHSTNSLSVVKSQDLTSQTDSPAGSRSKGKGEAGKARQRHESRTLDQYFYSSLPDTVRRDADQVIVRYQAKECSPDKGVDEKISSTGENASSPPPNKNNNTTNPRPRSSDQETNKSLTPLVNDTYLRYQEKFKLCVVDQLWLWVLDDKTIITCFPHAEKTGDQVKDHQNSPLDLICGHINRDMRPQIQNVYHLAALITSFCASSIDLCQARIVNGEETLLDMFAGSIGLVADKEVMLFNSFKTRLGVDVSDLKLDDDIELLEEIKDIRDELNILERILDDQDDLTQKLFNLFDIEKHEGASSRNLQDQVLQYYQQRAGIGLRLDRIKKMDEDAKISYDAITILQINFLLDLKQKHANVMEAKAAREQTQETADQGRTILVFTIVTIVFAPLSFLSSFFALNIETFPHTDGNISFPSSWIYWRVYGISVAIFVPLVVGTLAYGPMKIGWENRHSFHQTRLSSDKNTSSKSVEIAEQKDAVTSHYHEKLTRLTRNQKFRLREARGPDIESGQT